MSKSFGRMHAAGAALLVAGLAAGSISGAAAQSTDQQLKQMEKQLNMNATPDLGALGFQDDLTALEECQSGCMPLIDKMLAKYKTDPNFGGNPKLGAGDAQQLAAALATAAATLNKTQAATVAAAVAKSLGDDAATAYSAAYTSTTAPYDPK